MEGGGAWWNHFSREVDEDPWRLSSSNVAAMGLDRMTRAMPRSQVPVVAIQPDEPAEQVRVLNLRLIFCVEVASTFMICPPLYDVS